MKNRKTLILIIVIIALAAAIAVLLVILLTKKPATEQPDSSKGISGVIEEGWGDEIEPVEAEESDVRIPGYVSARMKEGDTTLHLSIGNPKENDVGLIARVELEDGTLLYESELLKPDFGIEDIPLLTSPKKGTYKAFVIYQIVSLDDDQTPMNSARSGFTLTVE